MKNFAIISFAALLLSGNAAECTRIFRPERHTRGDTNLLRIQEIDDAAWIGYPEETPPTATGYAAQMLDRVPSAIYRFRRPFTATSEKLTIDVSGDERFWLLLDGRLLAMGPHRGMVTRWYYQTYELAPEPGEHVLEAVVSALRTHAPRAQLSFRGGSFILKASGTYHDKLSTGKTEWTCAKLSGTSMTGRGHSDTFGIGDQATADGTGFLDEIPSSDKFCRAITVRPAIKGNKYGGHMDGWELYPSERPDQMHEFKRPGRIVNGDWPSTIPANTTAEFIWDLEDYYCAWPELIVSGGKGATITWGWTESLRRCNDSKRHGGPKGNRDEWKGKEFEVEFVDTFNCDGRDRAVFTVPWWRCGRWCHIVVKTAGEPLKVQKLSFAETRYPMPVEGAFACSDPTFDGIARISIRGMQECMHEMFFDCPYYEQQMYPGDSRLEMLYSNVLSTDDRLSRFGMTIFDYGRRSDGMTAMNFPTWGTQESATYTMCWMMMFGDYVMWHRNTEWLRARLPGIRNAASGLELHENAEGLLEDLPGWSFMDWSKGWDNGNAPDGKHGQGVSALNNLLYLNALRALVKVEEFLGHEDMATVWHQKANRLAKRIVEKFWCEERGAVADTIKKDRFSEHGQSLAILGDALSPVQAKRAFDALENDKSLTACTTYFAHYLFETYKRFDRADLFVKKLDMWRNFIKHGAKTPFETPEIEARSDCHAWCSAPIFHFHYSLAGVKPIEAGFRKVEVSPCPAGLEWIKAKTPHPDGFVETDLRFNGGEVKGYITLPKNITGVFKWKGTTQQLAPGRNEVAAKMP